MSRVIARDRNGSEIRVGDLLVDEWGTMYKVYDIRKSADACDDFVLVCRYLHAPSFRECFLYNRDLLWIDIVVTDDPCEFLESVPV